MPVSPGRVVVRLCPRSPVAARTPGFISRNPYRCGPGRRYPGTTRRRSPMTIRLLPALAAAGLLLVLGPGTAVADEGNVAVQSVGSVQIGATGTAPAASANTAIGTATISVPVGIAGSGGNTAKNSAGSVQVGGGNSATRSLGTAQVAAAHG